MKLHQPINRRGGFSLLELLVVIGFIAVLAALTASATFRIIGVQEEKTTQNNLIKLQSLLDQHWKAVIDKAMIDPIIPDSAYQLAGKNSNPPIPNFERRARIIHVKLSLRQYFPIMLTEIQNLPAPGYQWPKAYEAALTAGLTQEQIPSALFYLALHHARSGVSMDGSSILSSTDTIPTRHPDVKVIVDSWGTPIVFSRWPIFDPELNRNGPELAPPWRDPQDPTGLLSDDWVFSPQYGTFADKLHPTCFPPPSSPVKQMSYKLQPVLMSAGPDKQHGLSTQGPNTGSKEFASLKVVDQNQANDNIYTYRLRMGGSGN